MKEPSRAWRRWAPLVFLGLWALLVSGPGEAHLLNMTKVMVNIQPAGELSIDLQVDMSRAAGGPLEYYRLSQLVKPADDPVFVQLTERLVHAIDLRLDGTPIGVRLVKIELPRLSKEDFVNPLNWPMTQVRLQGTLPRPLHDARTLQGVMGTSFPFEEPISLTFSLDAEQRTMTRWLVAGQTSPMFALKKGEAPVQPESTDSGSLLRYVVFGFTHILPKGLDHVLFVLGLYLGARSFRSLLILVTSFTVAHSITLALAALGAVRLPPGIVEPLIAASIVWVGVENAFVKRASRYRPVLVFGFGLLHGLGFASALSELHLPSENFLLALLSFNVGIELGQLAVIALALAVTVWFRQKLWYQPRIAVPASVAIAVLAAIWTVQRIAV